MKTSTGEIYLDDRGVVIVRIDRDARQSLADAEENLAAAIKAAGGKKRPILTDIRLCTPMTPEARRYYSGKVLVDSFTALGILVSAGPFGTMMGNIYLRISKPGVPSMLFIDEEKALAWLEAQR